MNQLIKLWIDSLHRHTCLAQTGSDYTNGIPPFLGRCRESTKTYVFVACAKEGGACFHGRSQSLSEPKKYAYFRVFLTPPRNNKYRLVTHMSHVKNNLWAASVFWGTRKDMKTSIPHKLILTPLMGFLIFWHSHAYALSHCIRSVTQKSSSRARRTGSHVFPEVPVVVFVL